MTSVVDLFPIRSHPVVLGLSFQYVDFEGTLFNAQQGENSENTIVEQPF